MVFSHGVPVEYSGSRKADSIVRYMKKFVGPDVSVLESDSSIDNFIKTAGKDFPIFLGFGLETDMIEGFARQYKQKAWFSSIKDVSEDAMVAYDFDKSPALIVLHPKFNEKSVFYGPFDGKMNAAIIRVVIFYNIVHHLLLYIIFFLFIFLVLRNETGDQSTGCY